MREQDSFLGLGVNLRKAFATVETRDAWFHPEFYFPSAPSRQIGMQGAASYATDRE